MNAIDLVVMDNSLECLALRANLEWWGVKVHMHWIGKGQDLLDWNQEGVKKYVFLGGHGSEKGFSFPDLGPELAKEDPIGNFLGPAQIPYLLSFPNSIVISNACTTGSPEFGQAFLQAGASSYIAPSSYIEGNASLLFASVFCYFHFCKDWDLRRAYFHAMRQDEETQSFEWFSSDSL